MNSYKTFGVTRVAVLAAFFCAGPVVGQEQGTASSAGELAPTPLVVVDAKILSLPEAPAAVFRQNPFGSAPVVAPALAAKRGGNSVVNDNKLKGVVADNKASNLTTGMNVISDGAFAGSSGMPTVIQNSGNNVLIQNATIVNVQVK